MKNLNTVSSAIVLALGCFALSPAAQGALDPTDTAYGTGALANEAGGSNNSAFGYDTLYNNTTGSNNTATGASALSGNTTGSSNTATGTVALFINTTGNSNTANGIAALLLNTTGSENTATGSAALSNNTIGDGNTAIGANALFNTTGNNNIAVGINAGHDLTEGDNNIDIGNQGVADEANTIRIGTQGIHTNAYIAGIYQTTVARGLSVVIDSTGHVGTKGSSERFKRDIKPMDEASEAILALRPVSFRYKKEIDPEGTSQFGLVAEEVAKVNAALVDRGADGKLYSVRYDQVNAMLLNEFLKEHRKVEKLEMTVAEQQKSFQSKLADQQKQIEALSAGLQKVSAQVEVSGLGPQLATRAP